MSKPKDTVPPVEVPAAVLDQLQPIADLHEQARQIAEQRAITSAKLDEVQQQMKQVLDDLGAKDAKHGRQATAVQVDLDQRMIALHASCAAFGITAPPLPAPSLRAGMPPAGHAEQPIEHLARSAVTATQQLPDDVFGPPRCVGDLHDECREYAVALAPADVIRHCGCECHHVAADPSDPESAEVAS